MQKGSKKEGAKRRVISARFTEDEWAAIKNNAEFNKLCMGDFVQTVILGWLRGQK